MLKVIDVDLVADFTLELTFSDGYIGEANLTEYFQKEHLAMYLILKSLH